MKSRYSLFTGLLSLSFLIGGCESKFSESSPGSVKISGIPLEERVQLKAKVDSRIDEIQNGAERTKKIIDMFRRVQDPSNKSDVYTPIDFLIDINNELKGQIPENGEKGKLIRRGKIKLPFKNLSEECNTVETILVSDVEFVDIDGAKMVKSDNLNYNLKTCVSEGKYLPTVIATWDGLTLEFRVNNENLHTLFNNLLAKDMLRTSSCRFKHSDKKIIEKIACENIEIRLSQSEAAHVKTMSFDNNGEIRFETTADIFENQNKKAISFVRVMANGEVKFQLNKLNANGELQQPEQK